MKLEICIDSVASYRAAYEGGAKRVELCDNLVEGGTTPSLGMIEHIVEDGRLGVMMMIRPRGGDFLYSEDEFEVMKRNIRSAHTLGVQGVVWGILMKDGRIDKERSKELVDISRPLDITFHRAFDMTVEPMRAIDDLLELGIDRVLTSGQRADAYAGRSLIKTLQAHVGDNMTILPGGGINEENIEALVRETGVKECHVSARTTVRSSMTYINPHIYMGGEDQPEDLMLVADAKRVETMRLSAERAFTDS